MDLYIVRWALKGETKTESCKPCSFNQALGLKTKIEKSKHPEFIAGPIRIG
jgi:hypothetical protein